MYESLEETEFEEQWTESDRINSAQIDQVDITEEAVDKFRALRAGIELWACEVGDQYVNKKATSLRLKGDELIFVEKIRLNSSCQYPPREKALRIANILSVQKEHIAISPWWGVEKQFDAVVIHSSMYPPIHLHSQHDQDELVDSLRMLIEYSLCGKLFTMSF